MDILKAKKPEFAEEIEMILEDELQQSIEESKKKREEWSRGIWHYNVVMETYEWTGKEPPGEDNPYPDSGDIFVLRQCWPGEENLTDEEWKELERKWAEDEQSDWAKYLEEERNKKARENYQKKRKL